MHDWSQVHEQLSQRPRSNLTPGDLYESAFVPALFAEWAPHLVDMAEAGAGDEVLDVACGTGIVARSAADRVGTTGRVVGLDLNEAMLAVARRLYPDLDWRQGDAGSLPRGPLLRAVTCSFGLMFFPDRAAARRGQPRWPPPTMLTVALVVPASLSDQPAYGPFVETAARNAGPEAVSLLVPTGRPVTSTSCERSSPGRRGGGRHPDPHQYRPFPLPGDFVTTEVDSTPLRQRITDEVYDRIRADAHAVLAPYTTPTGSVEAPIVCHIVAARPICP